MESKLKSSLWNETISLLSKPLPLALATGILLFDLAMSISACSVIEKRKEEIRKVAHEVTDDIVDEAVDELIEDNVGVKE